MTLALDHLFRPTAELNANNAPACWRSAHFIQALHSVLRQDTPKLNGQMIRSSCFVRKTYCAFSPQRSDKAGATALFTGLSVCRVNIYQQHLLSSVEIRINEWGSSYQQLAHLTILLKQIIKHCFQEWHIFLGKKKKAFGWPSPDLGCRKMHTHEH